MVYFRNLVIKDSNEIAKVHLKSFPKFFLTSLGYSFLNDFYRTCFKSKEVISIGAVDYESNQIVGFVVGCLRSKGFYKRLIISNLRVYFIQFIYLFFLKPSALIRLLRNLSKKSGIYDDGDYAELLSLAVLPHQMGKGIGQDLLIKLEKAVKKGNVNKITLTTDSNLNETVLKFYYKLGYTNFYEFITYPNRKMKRLKKNLIDI